MPKKPKKRPEELTFDKFFGKWADSVRKGQVEEERPRGLKAAILGQWDSEPRKLLFVHRFSPEMWDEVSNWWPFHLLQEVAEEGDTEGYKRLLCYFLGRLGAPPPKGVVSAFRWPRGRPDETEAIYLEWMTMGAPVLTWREKDKLAKVFYPKGSRINNLDF